MKRGMAAVCCLIWLLMGSVLPCAATGPAITVEKTDWNIGDTVTVAFEGTDAKDWIGVYADGAAPGTTNAIIWEYAQGTGSVTFAASSFGGVGDFTVYLCDNDGYAVLDAVGITVSDGDTTDYGVSSLDVTVNIENGMSHLFATVTPSSPERLTYAFYWSRNGKRLEGYRPIASVEHEGGDSFIVPFNDGIFMPDDADGIEAAVKEGASASRFTSVTTALRLPDAPCRCEFQVITDLHVSESHPAHGANLTRALSEIAAFSPDSVAVFSVGDNTDRGTQAEYDLLKEAIAEAKGEVPPLYFAMGNHDTVYSGNYAMQVEKFQDNLGMESVYYAVEIEGTRFIVLGSDSQVGEGTMNDEQLQFLEDELAKVDPEEAVFVFMHQPLKDTVSGTLSWLDPEIQDWYGFVEETPRLREILNAHPNAVVFSGHTHWSLETAVPMLYGNGVEASYANAASVGYLWSDNDEAVGGSQGYYVEVYDEFVVLKGRDYLSGEWCAAAQFLIPLNGGTADVFAHRGETGVSVVWIAAGAAVLLGVVAASVAVLRSRKKGGTPDE